MYHAWARGVLLRKGRDLVSAAALLLLALCLQPGVHAQPFSGSYSFSSTVSGGTGCIDNGGRGQFLSEKPCTGAYTQQFVVSAIADTESRLEHYRAFWLVDRLFALGTH